jgi:hypothetical protein
MLRARHGGDEDLTRVEALEADTPSGHVEIGCD